jgi:hypothetical protein
MIEDFRTSNATCKLLRTSNATCLNYCRLQITGDEQVLTQNQTRVVLNSKKVS